MVLSDRLHEPVKGNRFNKVVQGIKVKTIACIFTKCSSEYYPRRMLECLHQFNSSHLWHLDIEENEVDSVLLQVTKGVECVAELNNNFEIIKSGNIRSQ